MIKTFEFVNPISKFTCPICSKEHETYKDAQACIDSHAMAERVVGSNGINLTINAPGSVVIELTDGRLMKYYLAGNYEEPQEVNDQCLITKRFNKTL